MPRWRPATIRPVSTPLPATPPPGIALFDLDGTLLAWDCQLLFRHFVVRRQPWRALLLPAFLALAPLAPVLGTTRMKRAFLSYLWQIRPDQLATYARDFARALMPAIYPELRAEVERHRAAGNLLVLSSASPEFYVAEIGRLLGFDLSLGTRVTPGSWFPALVNHKGAAKVERLREVLPNSYFAAGGLRACHGYTDSRADLPMLALCQSATLVNPDPALTAHARDAGWNILRPSRPWRSRPGFAWRAAALLTGLGRDPGGLNPQAR